MSQKQEEAQERHDSWMFWKRHVSYLQENLQKKRIVSDGALEILAALTRRENIGAGEGQIQPGVLGQWDVFYFLFGCGNVTCSERLLLSGLPAGEVALAEERLELEQSCFNPSDPDEVREFERIQRMSKAEVKREMIQVELKYRGGKLGK